MTIKEELMEIRHLNTSIESMLRDLEDLRNLKGISYDMEGKGSGKRDTSDTVVKIIDLEDKINDSIDNLIDKKSCLLDDILQLKAIHRTIITMRYFECRSWEQIAVDINYNYRWTLRLHGQALQSLSDKRIKRGH